MQDTDGVIVKGQRYVSLVTTLLQQLRLARPTGGIWEAADFQWAWRRPRATDARGQLFWLDDAGEPLAAAVLTEFGTSVQCDVLVLRDDSGYRRKIWQQAIRWAEAAEAAAEFVVRQDDEAGLTALREAGYRLVDERGVVTTWLNAARRPRIPPLAAGYELLSRAQAGDMPHPMTGRNGAEVEARLRTCSLYRPELDLMVRAPDGEVAGYSLYWADDVTGVGLLEPMRTEEAHERRGIASHMLAAGLDLLAACGCQRLKVANDIPLYLRAGFVPLPEATAQVYARAAG